MNQIPGAILDKEPNRSANKKDGDSGDHLDSASADQTDSYEAKDINLTINSKLENNSKNHQVRRTKLTDKKFTLPIHIILMFVAIIGLLLIVYLYYPSEDKNKPLTDNNLSSVQLSRIVHPEQKLEKIAERLIENDNLWDPVEINDFVEIWNRLSKPTRQDLADSIWYKHFEFVISTKLRELTRHKSSDVMLVGSSAPPIMILAFTLDILKTIQPLGNRRAENKKFRQLLAKVQSELSKVDTAKRRASNTESPNPLLNDALRQEFETTPLPEHNSSLKNFNPSGSKQPAIFITGDKIRELLTTFKQAYKAGNAEKIQTLFLVDKQAKGSTLVSDLLDSYRSVFNSSDSRKINFYRLEWSYNGYTATANGFYQAVIKLPENNDRQVINAGITIELQILEKQLKIAKFIFHDKILTTSNPNLLAEAEPDTEELLFLASGEAPLISIATKPPNNKELNNIIKKFVSAYESGNIELLVSTLSDNITTNDKFSLKDITQDYVGLFARSSARKMQIEELRWKINKDHAKGTGNLSAAITMIKNNSVNRIKGKIQFIVKRIDNNILITHLYHIERNN